MCDCKSVPLLSGWGYCYHRLKASEAVEKARLVEDYWQRKKEAAAYKARGQQWMMVSIKHFIKQWGAP